MRAHFDSELWGLAMHPTKTEMVTVGRDAMLAVWDIPSRTQKKVIKLEGAADAVAFSNNGQHICVGFMNGKFQAFDSNFTVLRQRSDRKGKSIQCIKYSPDDRVCAMGAHDSMIITYDVTRNYAPLKKIRSHHSTVTHLDFT